MYEDPNVYETTVTVVFTFATDEATEATMRDEIVTRAKALADELGHDLTCGCDATESCQVCV